MLAHRAHLFQWFIQVQAGIQFFDTHRAYAVGEPGFGILADIRFNSIPVPFVISDFHAVGADGQQATEGVDLGLCMVKFILLSPEFSHGVYKFTVELAHLVNEFMVGVNGVFSKDDEVVYGGVDMGMENRHNALLRRKTQ